MSRIGLIAIAGLALAAVSGVGATGGATADPAKRVTGCPADTLCVWSGKNYQGQRVKLTSQSGISNKLAKVMNNQASSYKNKFTDDDAVLYDKKDGGGDFWGICPLESDPSLVDFNNRASSSSIGSMRRSQVTC